MLTRTKSTMFAFCVISLIEFNDIYGLFVVKLFQDENYKKKLSMHCDSTNPNCGFANECLSYCALPIHSESNQYATCFEHATQSQQV